MRIYTQVDKTDFAEMLALAVQKQEETERAELGYVADSAKLADWRELAREIAEGEVWTIYVE